MAGWEAACCEEMMSPTFVAQNPLIARMSILRCWRAVDPAAMGEPT